MMWLIIGMAFFVSPWISVIMAIASKSIRIEYKKHGMRSFAFYSALVISLLAYCTYNVAFGDFAILTSFLIRIGERPLSAYVSPEIVSAIGPFNWIFFIIAKSRDYALMCMLPGFIIYYVYGKITSEISVEKECKYQEFLKVYFIGMLLLQFFSVLEHGRFIMAGCILIYAVYREVYLRKKDGWSILLYILPLCFHVAVLPLYAFRILANFFLKHKLGWLAAIAFAYVMIMYGGSFFSSFPYAITNYIAKAQIYFSGGSAWGRFVYTNRFYVILRVVFDVTFIVIALLIIKLSKNKAFCDDTQINRGKRLFLSFTLQLTFFSLITNLIVADAFWRYGTLLFFIVPALLVYARYYFPFKTYQAFKYAFLGLGTVICLMHIAMVVRNNILIYDNFIQNVKSISAIRILIKDIFPML